MTFGLSDAMAGRWPGAKNHVIRDKGRMWELDALTNNAVNQINHKHQ
jgi:hypothetical protein